MCCRPHMRCQHMLRCTVLNVSSFLVNHLLVGAGSDSSTYPCVYCEQPSAMVSISNENGGIKNFRSMPLSLDAYNLRSYETARVQFETFKKLGCTPQASKKPEVCSQTSEPSPLLSGSPDFLSIMVPDTLHLLLGVSRVSFYHFMTKMI